MHLLLHLVALSHMPWSDGYGVKDVKYDFRRDYVIWDVYLKHVHVEPQTHAPITVNATDFIIYYWICIDKMHLHHSIV